MSNREEDSDSDAPEEITAQQAIQREEEITKLQKENKARILREAKERRRKWAQKITPKKKPDDKIVEEDDKIEEEDVTKFEVAKESQAYKGMLSEDIVKFLAGRENKVFLSDSEEEVTDKKSTLKKKKRKSFGVEPVILTEIASSHCLQSSLEFLKRRKMQVSRSSAVLDNSNKALRFLSASGLLSKK